MIEYGRGDRGEASVKGDGAMQLQTERQMNLTLRTWILVKKFSRGAIEAGRSGRKE